MRVILIIKNSLDITSKCCLKKKKKKKKPQNDS